MITNIWCSQSDNYQRIMQWSPICGVANLTTISTCSVQRSSCVWPIPNLTTILAQRAMITNDWSSQSDNYTRTASNDHQWLANPLWQISAQHAMIAHIIWCSQSYICGAAQRAMITNVWYIDNLTTIQHCIPAQHAMLTNIWCSQSDNYQRNMQWSPIFGVANLTTISATGNDHQYLV